ncbi:MAG TPA: hypothetical protein VMV31_12935 [Terriglobales bacterium]|nr:hypothetical protein [Terriglobales bacterium]
MLLCLRLPLAPSPPPPAGAAQAPASPPPAAAIEARLIAAFQNDQEALLHFQHLEHVVTGRDGAFDGRTLHVWYVHGHAVSETIALDHRALSPKEIAAEHQRALIRARDAAQRPPAPAGVVVFDGQRYPFAKLADDYLYRDPQRRVWRGREIWVYQAYPNPATASRSRAESLLLHSQGVVWVDAADLHVIRIELHTTSPVRYGLGVLATIHSAGLELDLERHSPGVWLPAHADFHLSATVLLVKSLLRSKQQTFSDYTPNGAGK